LKCARCMSVWYCGPVCQRRHWRERPWDSGARIKVPEAFWGRNSTNPIAQAMWATVTPEGFSITPHKTVCPLLEKQQAEALEIKNRGDASTHEGKYNIAANLMSIGNYREAIKMFREVLYSETSLTRSCNIHQLLSTCFYMGRCFPEALEELHRALKLRGDDELYATCNYSTARILEEISTEDGIDRLDEIIKHYQETVRYSPGNSEAYHNMGNCFTEKGQEKEAIKCFKQALSQNNGFTFSFLNLSLSLVNEGRLAEAKEAAMQAVRANPGDPRHAQHLKQIKQILREEQARNGKS